MTCDSQTTAQSSSMTGTRPCDFVAQNPGPPRSPNSSPDVKCSCGSCNSPISQKTFLTLNALRLPQTLNIALFSLINQPLHHTLRALVHVWLRPRKRLGSRLLGPPASPREGYKAIRGFSTANSCAWCGGFPSFEVGLRGQTSANDASAPAKLEPPSLAHALMRATGRSAPKEIVRSRHIRGRTSDPLLEDKNIGSGKHDGSTTVWLLLFRQTDAQKQEQSSDFGLRM
jgi:hypothetical protein